MRRLVSVIVLAAALTACEGPKTGEVTDKDYDAAWTEIRSYCAQHNKNGTCKFTSTIPVRHPESCALRLVKGEEDGWMYIPCTEFDLYQVGDYYPKDM